MTEQDLLRVVQSIRPEVTGEALDLAVEESGLDSFDLLELRATLEAKGSALADGAWLGAQTLRDLLRLLG